MIPSYRMPKHLHHRMRFLGKTINEIGDENVKAICESILALQSPNPEVSIVIIAWNEERNLVATIDSLSGLKTDKRIEIIAVDNNSSDLTAETIKRLGVQYVFEGTQGYAPARQAGLNNAVGEFVLSADADTLYPEFWVNSMLAPFKNKDVAFVSGLYAFYLPSVKRPLALRLFQIAKHLSIWLKKFKRPHLVCMGGTSAYRKSKALEVGGYDVSLGEIRGEDGTLAWYLAKTGKIVILKGRRGMVWTSMRRTMGDGTLWEAFKIRMNRDLKQFGELLTKQTKR